MILVDQLISQQGADDTSYSTCVPDALSNLFAKPVIGERRTGGEKPCDDLDERGVDDRSTVRQPDRRPNYFALKKSAR